MVNGYRFGALSPRLKTVSVGKTEIQPPPNLRQIGCLGVVFGGCQRGVRPLLLIRITELSDFQYSSRPDYGSEGWGFEFLRARLILLDLQNRAKLRVNRG